MIFYLSGYYDVDVFLTNLHDAHEVFEIQIYEKRHLYHTVFPVRQYLLCLGKKNSITSHRQVMITQHKIIELLEKLRMY